jgi:hypothetical protein
MEGQLLTLLMLIALPVLSATTGILWLDRRELAQELADLRASIDPYPECDDCADGYHAYENGICRCCFQPAN